MTPLAVKVLRFGLVLTLSLWIAGAGCMFGCGDMAARASSLQAAPQSESNKLAAIVSGDACAANGSHDCCAKKRATGSQATSSDRTAKLSLKTAALISQTTAVDSEPARGITECPLALSRAVAITKSSDRNQVASLDLPITASLFVTSTEFQTGFPLVARLPNRGHTYLRCCVFLI